MTGAHYRCGDFDVDLGNRRFLHSGREVPLEPRVFAVIAQLLVRAGTLVTRNELLDAVWGHRYVTPSALNRTIALARRAFGDDVAEPRFIQTVHGAGYRYVGPQPSANPVEIGSRARFAPSFAARLPARIDALIGRDAELAALEEFLRQHRMITVLGAGGMGKTQCALEGARRAAGDYPDGVWFFDLSPISHAGEWMRLLGSALAMPSAIPDLLLPQICALLRERHALIVLDNCDRVAADLGSIVFQILRGTESVRFLATSQRPLNLAGEQILRMPPLRVPEEFTPTERAAERIGAYPAVALLLERIRAVRPDFEISEGNAATLGDICRRLDGMPLALELAAARFALLSPEQVLERLEERFRFLGSDSAGRDVRHRNLRSLLEWSYGLLSAAERRLLNGTALFVQSWSMEAFVAMAGILGHEPEAAIDLLSGLVSHSLVSLVADVSPLRYRLLESVREYALVQLRSSGLEDPARRAHLQAMVVVCRAAHHDVMMGRMRERIEQLALDRGNVQAALETANTPGSDRALGLEILGSLIIYAKGHGDYMTVLRWCRQVLAPATDAETPALARALLTLGVVQVHLARADVWSAAALPDAARIAGACGDWWTEAYALGYHALGCINEGRHEEADRYAQRAREAAEQHRDELLTGLAGLAVGWIWLARGEPQRALAELNAVRDLGPDLHQRHFIDMYIGLALFAMGREAEAARQWLESLKLSIAVGNLRGMAGSIEGCAYLSAGAGEWAAAARLLTAARLIRERTQVPLFRFWRPHRDAVLAALKANLAEAALEAQMQAGAALRQEDATNAALATLQAISRGRNLDAGQSATNLASGS